MLANTSDPKTGVALLEWRDVDALCEGVRDRRFGASTRRVHHPDCDLPNDGDLPSL